MFGEEYGRSEATHDEAVSLATKTNKQQPKKNTSNNKNKSRNTRGRANTAPPSPAARPLNNLLHQDTDEEQERPKTVQEIIRELDAEQNVSGPKGGCCARLFIPLIVALLVFGVVAATVWTSGTGVDGAAEPRVALIVFEGLSGSSFESLLQAGQRLPNIAHLLQHHAGRHAECGLASSSHCAHATAVENATTGEVSYCAACGLASILSGVSPALHEVRADTLAEMARYADTSKRFPSLARLLTTANRGVAVVGTSHLLHSFASMTGRCAAPGVLDMECAPSAEAAIANSIDPFTELVSLECLPTSSCNANIRKIRQPTNPNTYSDGREEEYFTRQLTSLFGALAFSSPSQEGAVQNSIADNVKESCFIFHFDTLAVRAESAALPDFTYDVSSKSFVAQAYLLDALLGQLFAFLQDRSRSQKENWLILGTAAHGGVGKSHSSDAAAQDEIGAVPFFMATYTSSARRYIRLNPLTRPVSQLDVVPTVLRWLNVAPYDDITERVVRGEEGVEVTPEIEQRVKARRVFEGHVQGICSSGVMPVDCIS